MSKVRSILAILNEQVYQVGDYDKMAILMTLGLDDIIRRSYLKLMTKYIRDKKNLKVLDLGCGTGLNVKHILALIPRCHLLLVDISLAGLKIAYKKFSRLVNVDFICCSATFMCTRSESVDLVVTSYMLRQVDLAKLACELYRIVKKSGLCMIVDFWRSIKTLNYVLLLVHLALLVPLFSIFVSPRTFRAYSRIWTELIKVPDVRTVCKAFLKLFRVHLYTFKDYIYMWILVPHSPRFRRTGSLHV